MNNQKSRYREETERAVIRDMAPITVPAIANPPPRFIPTIPSTSASSARIKFKTGTKTRKNATIEITNEAIPIPGSLRSGATGIAGCG